MNKDHIRDLLLSWRDRTVTAAGLLLTRLFAAADQVLLEYADRAENNAIQIRFSDGRRELQRRREAFIRLFCDTLQDKMLDFMDSSIHPVSATSEVLSLVSKDVFERSLALQTISEQATRENPQLYYALSQRLGVVIGGPAVPLSDLPAGPHQLAGAFEHTAHILEVEREVLLALYTLCERELIQHSPPWHEELNQSLSAAGILPNLRHQVQRRPRPAAVNRNTDDAQTGPSPEAPATPAQPARTDMAMPRSADRSAAGHRGDPDPDLPGEQDSGEQPGLGDQLLGRIREILSAQRMRRDGGATRADPADPAPTATITAAIDRAATSEEAVIDTSRVVATGAPQIIVSRALLEKLRFALAAQRTTIKENIGHDRLSLFDEDTIDIVGMLFELMLDDDRLVNTVKALLSHLHTPYLKLAVRDRAFLTRRGHPARRLFDKLIEAGSRWIDESDLGHGMYPKLQWVVESITSSKQHDLALFQQLEKQLDQEIHQLSNRQQNREVRTLETEQGKARLEQARSAAGHITSTLLATELSPTRYQEFITGPWKDYLTLLHLRSNGKSDDADWHEALDLGRRLRKCILALTAEMSPDDDELAALHDALAQRLGDTIPHYAIHVEKLFEIFSTDQDYDIAISLSQPTSTTATAPSFPADTKLTSRGKRLQKRLPQLPPGSWVVFHHHDSADQVVKLSWFNPTTRRFLFVDQAGARALVIPLNELSSRIDQERAHVLHATGSSYVESSLRRALNALQNRS